MQRRNGFAILVALAFVVAVTGTACEAPPPRVVLTVDAAGAAPDATPGDGSCATSTGTCTLAAAIDEGNALGKAAISLPAGDYDVAGETVTGTLWINDRTPDLGVRMTGLVTVAEGGALVLDGAISVVGGQPAPAGGALRFRVDGTLVLRDVQLFWVSATEPLVHVRPSGVALVDTSFVSTGFAPNGAVVNEGRFWLRHSWLFNIGEGFPTPGYSLATLGSGVSTVGTSIIAPPFRYPLRGFPFTGCTGTPPVSAGHNAFFDTTCGPPGTGGVSGIQPVMAQAPTGEIDITLTPDAPLVDAIPIGVHGCGSEPWGDWYGQPAPADGNGDGLLACDIGPKELQPAA